MKRKLRLKQNVRNVIGVVLFYLALIGGCLLINGRYNDLCENGYTQYCSAEE